MKFIRKPLSLITFFYGTFFISNIHGSTCLVNVTELVNSKKVIIESTEYQSLKKDSENSFLEAQRLSLEFFQEGKYKNGLSKAYLAYRFSSTLEEGYIAIAMSRMGINLLKMGDIRTAKSCHEEARNIFKNLKNPAYNSQLAWENVNLGRIYKRLQMYDEAQKLFLDAISIFEQLFEQYKKEEYKDYFLNATAEQIDLHLTLGELRKAQQLFLNYESNFKVSKKIISVNEAYAREVFSRLFLALNDIDNAIRQIKIGQELIVNLPNYYLHPKFLSNLCSAYKKKGDLISAYDYCLEAIQYINKSRKIGFSEFSSINESRTNSKRTIANYFDTALLALDQIANAELEEETFVILQDLSIENFNKRMSFILENKESFLSKRDERQLKERNIQTKNCELIGKEIVEQKSLEKILALSDSFKVCEKKLRRIKYEIEDSSVRKFLVPRSHKKSDLQKNLEQDEAVVSFFFDEEYSFIWGLTKDSLYYKKLKLSGNDLKKLIAKVKDSLIHSNPYNIKPFDKEASNRLFKNLLYGFINENPNINSLIIVKDELLNQLPFSVLNIKDSFESSEWLFEKVNLYYISHFEELRARSSSKIISKFYGFGDPLPREGYKALANSSEELIELAKGFSALKDESIFTGENSTIDALSKIEHQNAAIAFSTHAIKPGDDPNIEDPAILLDDWLSSKDIAFRYKINPNLVILSACDTAWTSSLEKPILDLPSSFRIGGAGIVVASNWRIQDKQTREIMNQASEFIYLNRGKKNLISEALREGKLNYIKKNQGKTFNSTFGKVDRSHPYFWGPFEIIGLPNI